MNNTITVESTAEVRFGVIAEQFADMISAEQAIFLSELFDALKFKCKDESKFNMQLSYIADQIKARNLKDLSNAIETLNLFITKGNKE